MKEKILISSDHGGFILKELIIKKLSDLAEFMDLGPGSEDSVDYPDFAAKLSEKISSGEYGRGILVCGTGIGMCITANKYRNVRAALATTTDMARLSMEHNNANILCLGGRITEEGLALEIVKTWLRSRFEGDRHQRRLDKISKIEEK